MPVRNPARVRTKWMLDPKGLHPESDRKTQVAPPPGCVTCFQHRHEVKQSGTDSQVREPDPLRSRMKQGGSILKDLAAFHRPAQSCS